MTSIAPPSNTRNNKTTDDWITPLWLREAIGPFDLDPCASVTQPWPMAAKQYTIKDNGLALPWNGFVWMNPPYGKAIDIWLGRLANHGDGVALVFARTETKSFFNRVWPKASALLFLRGRLTFHRPDGSAPKLGHNSGGPSVLIGYGDRAYNRLCAASHLGAFVNNKANIR